jgi:hypothetical protein
MGPEQDQEDGEVAGHQLAASFVDRYLYLPTDCNQLGRKTSSRDVTHADDSALPELFSLV